jgi:hypothetical protein
VKIDGLFSGRYKLFPHLSAVNLRLLWRAVLFFLGVPRCVSTQGNALRSILDRGAPASPVWCSVVFAGFSGVWLGFRQEQGELWQRVCRCDAAPFLPHNGSRIPKTLNPLPDKPAAPINLRFRFPNRNYLPQSRASSIDFPKFTRPKPV